ncbi:MAG: T9SS type A sorting domain-containing protein [Flavobacterium sp.]|uniref:T9SS type A sorting domain-containing protein n=1 Tax=Flavobacterium sp. TaxID=239 RepID=UPI003265979B
MRKLYFTFLLLSAAMFAQPGNLCTDPIVIASLPLSVTDNTANYGDNYDPPTATPISCGAGTAGNYYLSGNDVIYSYAPTASGVVNIQIPSALAWTGLFVFNSCADIGSPPYACNCSSASGNRTINNMVVTAGQTYYIVISSWSTPQTIPYTLNITDANLGINQATLLNGLKLYPNPVTNVLNLDTEASIKNVNIITVNGQRIETKLNGTNQINVESLQNGFYILEVNTEDGAKVYKNFVKGS